jgi:hypothetical protein
MAKPEQPPESALTRYLVRFAVCVMALILVHAPVAAGQVLYGSIVGHVTDASDTPIPGVPVIATHEESGLTRETTTDQAGQYQFSTMPTGTYTVRASLQGFQTFERPNIAVSLNSVARVNVRLRIGDLNETIVVAAEVPMLQTDRAEVRVELGTKELENMPVPLGRNYQQLFKFIPGFAPPTDQHSVPTNPSRALGFNVNGASHSANNTRIDGVSTQNVQFPHIAAYVPALESLETVNVVTNSFDAEQGLAGGSAINVQIKSGTNTFRGSAFEYHHNEALRSRNYFAAPESRQGDFSYNQFGGTLGGPIARNKLFFFGSYESTLDRQIQERTVTVPTEALRRGDLSASANPIYDPLTGSPDGSGRAAFPGNQIPQARIDPTARWIIERIPLPNLPGQANNYFVQAPFTFDRWTFDGKVNWNVNNRLNTFLRVSRLSFETENATVFGDELQGPSIAGGNAGIGSGFTNNVSLGVTYTATPNFVVDANVGWVRMDTRAELSNIDTKVGSDILGLPGTNGSRHFEGSTPSFLVSNYTGYGVSEISMPYYRDDRQWQYVLNSTWVKGRHSVRFGGDIGFQGTNHIQASIGGSLGLGARGGFEFGPGPTQVRGGPTGTNFNSWATFLLGLPTRAGRDYLLEAPYTARNQLYSFYVRDQWQVGQKLMLSYGTRWEYFPVPTRADRGLERYNPATNMMEIGGMGGVPMDLGVKISKTQFAPRLGLAWRPSEEMVVRAGYGVTNDPFPLTRPMTRNFPVVLSMAVQAPNAFQYAGTVQQGIPDVEIPDLSSGAVPVPGNLSVLTLPSEFDRGYIQSWNATVERQLGLGFVAEAGYVGTRQNDLLGYQELNWSPINGGRAGRQLFGPHGRDASTRIVAPVGDTSYHSLQARVQRRFADGYQFQANYTWSRSMGIAGNENSDGSPEISIPEYFHLNRALSSFDRTHALHILGIAEVPFGRGRRWLNNGGALAAIAGGWQVNSAISFYSGQPFTITSAGTSLNAPGSTQMADQVKPEVEILKGIGRGNPWFDPLAFAPVLEPRFGNAGFNTMRGPGYANWDLGVFRVIGLGSTRTIEIRFEAFNVLNTPHFNNPGSNVSSVQRNPDGTIRNLNGFAEVTSAYGERVMRLGLRLAF